MSRRVQVMGIALIFNTILFIRAVYRTIENKDWKNNDWD